MATHRFGELLARLPADRRRRIASKTKELLLLEADLQEMRRLLGVTQAELAERLEMSQGQVSETEHREDFLLSTLRRYVQALGGKLEVMARFGKKKIRLRGV